MLDSALKYVKRKKVRSSIILLCFVVVLIALNMGMYINFKFEKIEKNIDKDKKLSFEITKKFKMKDKSEVKSEDLNPNMNITESKISKKEVEEINALKEVSDFNYISKGDFKLDGEVVESESGIKLDGGFEEMKGLVKAEGVLNTEKLSVFSSNALEITKGRGIEKEDKRKALVHEELLNKNKYKIGDKIVLKNLDKKMEFEIVGAYKGKLSETYTGLTSDFTENLIFIDYGSKSFLDGNDKNIDKVIYYAKDKESLEKIEKYINEKNEFEINRKNEVLEDTFENIKEVKNNINLMILLIDFGVLAMLSLILMLWLRDRIYEIGILLSIGKSKLDIVFKFFLEVFVISAFSFVLSFALNFVFNKYLLTSFFKKILIDDSFNLKYFIQSNIYAYLNLSLVIMLSILLSSISIIFKKPKNILKQIG